MLQPGDGFLIVLRSFRVKPAGKHPSGGSTCDPEAWPTCSDGLELFKKEDKKLHQPFCRTLTLSTGLQRTEYLTGLTRVVSGRRLRRRAERADCDGDIAGGVIVHVHDVEGHVGIPSGGLDWIGCALQQWYQTLRCTNLAGSLEVFWWQAGTQVSPDRFSGSRIRLLCCFF